MLVLAAALLIGAAILLGLNLQAFRASFGWVQHTNNVRLQIAHVETSLSRMETSTRGYVLGGDEFYLRRALAEEINLRETLEDLKSMVRDSNDQKKRTVTLTRLVEHRIGILHQMMAAGHNGLEIVGTLLREPAIRNELYFMRRVLIAMRSHEDNLLVKRQQDSDRTATFYFAIAIGTALIAVFLVSLGVWLLQWERNRMRFRDLQMRLFHVQRLSTVEATASAMAHELNQPLAAASNYVGALRNMMKRSEDKVVEEWSEIVDSIGRQIERATNIITRLRNFVSGQEPERTLESPGGIVEDAVALLGTLDSSMRLELHTEAHLPDVFVDRIQIQQVLVNLMRNAIEAMHETASPKLVLEAKQSGLDLVEITLRDNGPGLPPQMKEQLFQPFVTTKESGMGVGLSICRSIIEHHNGRIWAESSPETGTAFHFTIPVARERDAA